MRIDSFLRDFRGFTPKNLTNTESKILKQGETMNKIQKLLQELCPNGVEYKALGEVCEFRNGFSFKASKFKTSGFKIIRIGNIQNDRISFDDIVCFDKDDYPRENLAPFKLKSGDILIAMSGATTGKMGYFELNEECYLNQRVGKFIPNLQFLNNKFLYYFFTIKNRHNLPFSRWRSSTKFKFYKANEISPNPPPAPSGARRDCKYLR